MELRLLDSLAAIPAADWDGLHDGNNPFVSHAFLFGLERHGCLRPAWGWQPRHAALFEDGRLLAAAPAYLKTNSHGEFVFDHAWAHAYARYGQAYFPKWLGAVPYSPVPGPRALAAADRWRQLLVEAMRAQADADGLSSLHFNFVREPELEAFDPAWLARADIQFHWHNPGHWQDFHDFLGAFNSRKRKTLKAERLQVQKAGLRFRHVHGDEATDADLGDMHAFYCMTQQEKGNSPVLSLAFFRHLAGAMPRNLLLVLAERNGQTIAGALFLRGGDTLYGRYWGASESVPGLHFETCYYQGIEYCLQHGLARFEPGAQGEHKVARGFLPVITHSRHHVRDPGFAAALKEWCTQERMSVLRYRDGVLEHSPFREPPSLPAGP